MSLLTVAPRMRQLAPGKSATLSVLDIGTSKIACLIARLSPAEPTAGQPRRTHRAKLLGIGHQRSRGIKGGVVVDMQEANSAIRMAVDAAERMAGVQVEGVIVNVTGGRLSSQLYSAKISVGGRAVANSDIQRVLEAAASASLRQGRAVLHALPNGFSLDNASGVQDPRGMIGDELAAHMHVISSDSAAVRNLMLAVEQAHLTIEAVVATPYAAGLATLVDDEAEMGAAVVDMGGGTTSVGVFSGGNMVHSDAFAVGGNHVTLDLARGLTTRLSDAERLKTMHGSCLIAASDEREMVSVPQVGEEGEHPNYIPKNQLNKIIRPRVEEILELVRDRLKAAGFAAHAGRRLVLTGGAAQLTGLPELARGMISNQVRIGRPMGLHGLPESAKSPAFAAAAGLVVYPQVAGVEHFEPQRHAPSQATGTDGYIARVGRWLKDSF